MDNTSPRSVFDAASPKLTFWFGFFVGAGLMTLLGFVFLVVLMVKGVDLPGTSAPSKTTTTTNTNTAATTTPTPTTVNASDIPVNDDDYVRGNPDAKVTIVAFSDIECPFCKRFHPSLKAVFDANADDVRWVFKHFPLSFHPEAKPAAVASECVGKLAGNDAFWTYVDTLYEKQNELGDALYAQEAANVGVNADEFATCLDSGEFNQKIAADQQLGQSIGVGGTPSTFVISGDVAEKLNGAVSQAEVEAAVADALAR